MSGDSCTVRIDPSGFELEIKPGENFLDAIFNAGEEWPTTCFGQLECMLCTLEIREGEELAVEKSAEESEALEFRYTGDGDPTRLRLACCLEFRRPGAVTVWKKQFRR